MNAITEARILQRRINAALATTTFPKARLNTLGNRLHRYRQSGSVSALRGFLADYDMAIDGELRTAVKWRYAKPVFAWESAA